MVMLPVSTIESEPGQHRLSGRGEKTWQGPAFLHATGLTYCQRLGDIAVGMDPGGRNGTQSTWAPSSSVNRQLDTLTRCCIGGLALAGEVGMVGSFGVAGRIT
jgi:hypothetical protein